MHTVDFETNCSGSRLNVSSAELWSSQRAKHGQAIGAEATEAAAEYEGKLGKVCTLSKHKVQACLLPSAL